MTGGTWKARLPVESFAQCGCDNRNSPTTTGRALAATVQEIESLMQARELRTEEWKRIWRHTDWEVTLMHLFEMIPTEKLLLYGRESPGNAF
jgi:hypothetical protein